VTSAGVERAAAAAEYWARLPRRDDDAILGSVAGLSGHEVAEVISLLETRKYSAMSDAELLGQLAEMATKSRTARIKWCQENDQDFVEMLINDRAVRRAAYLGNDGG
jgi:hypothetical protein